MSGSKFILLGVAAAAGVGAVALVQSELDAARSTGAPVQTVVQETPKMQVLTAAHALRRGQPLRDGALEWRDWPQDMVREHFITSDARPEALEEFATALAKVDIVEGAPLKLEQMIMLDHPGVLSAMLRENMRAFAISIALETGAGGFVLPGDYVDVILTRDVEMYVCSPEGRYETKRFLKADTLLSTVRVLAVDTDFDPGEEATTAMDRTATLEVNGEQAVLLSLAERAGRLTLALRGIGELVDDSGAPREELWPVTLVKLDLAKEALAIAAAARSGEMAPPSILDLTDDGHGGELAKLEPVSAEAEAAAKPVELTLTIEHSDCNAADDEKPKGPVVQMLRGGRLSDSVVQ